MQQQIEERKAQMEKSLQANLDQLGSKIGHRTQLGTFPDIQRSRSGMDRPTFGGSGRRGAASRSVSVAPRVPSRYS